MSNLINAGGPERAIFSSEAGYHIPILDCGAARRQDMSIQKTYTRPM